MCNCQDAKKIYYFGIQQNKVISFAGNAFRRLESCRKALVSNTLTRVPGSSHSILKHCHVSFGAPGNPWLTEWWGDGCLMYLVVVGFSRSCLPTLVLSKPLETQKLFVEGLVRYQTIPRIAA
jgi:hypothetical protein